MTSAVTFNEANTAHLAGHGVSLCADSSGANEVNFVSYGGDSILHLWTLADDSLAPTVERSYDGKKESGMVPGPLAWTGDHIYVADNKKSVNSAAENTVWRFDVESLSTPRRQDDRYPSSLTSINASEDGNYLVCSSKELLRNLHLSVPGRSFDWENYSDDIVRATAFDPLSQLYAVLTGGGKVLLYSVQKATANGSDSGCLQTIDVSTFSDSDKLKFSLCFSRESDHLYVPSKGRVVIFKRGDTDVWAESTSLPYQADEEICLCALSKGGRFLATTTASNKIVVWDVEADHPSISSSFVHRCGKISITSILWNPADDEEISLIVADIEGKIWVLSNFHGFVDGSTNTASVGNVIFNDENSMDYDDASVRVNRTIAPLDDEDDDGISIGAIKAAYSQEDDFPSIAPIVPTTTVVEYEPPVVPSPFMAGSTPMKLKKRLLKRNEHGTIASYDDAEISQLEIRFHDAAIHHPIDMNNENTRFVLGDISSKAVALASVRDGSSPSELYVHHIASTDADSSKAKWSVQLPGKESIQLVVLGERFVAIYTTHGFIRVFSLAGTQRRIISHSDPVLTMCATKNLLTVMSTNGGPFFVRKSRTPNFKISAFVYTVELRDVGSPIPVQEIPVAVTPGSDLAWVHYSIGGALCTMDSECCVRMLSASGEWIPILVARDELLQSTSDYLWPIAVTEDKVQYFLCSENMKYPEVSRKDVRSASWQTPIVAKGSQTSEIEGILMIKDLLLGLSSTTDASNSRKQVAAELRKLFLYTLASGFESRALELASMVTSEKEAKNMCQLVSGNREKLRLRDQLCDKVGDVCREALTRREKRSQTVSEVRTARLSAVHEGSAFEENVRTSFRPKIKNAATLLRPTKRPLDDDFRSMPPTFSETTTSTPLPSSSQSQVSILSSLTPVSSGNPFASRAGSARPTLDDSCDSIFDLIGTAPSTAKRPKNEKIPNQKQTRLSSFAVVSSSGTDENLFPRMDQWIANNSTQLKAEYEISKDADGKSYEAFAVGQYKTAKKLDRAQKN